MIAAVAVNDRTVLANCLERSPDVVSGELPLERREGFASAALAYNHVLDGAPPGTVIIFAHQDVYLPAGYIRRLSAAVREVEAFDKDWALLALSARSAEGAFAGKVWSTAWSAIHQGGELPAPIVTADELLLVVRAGAGLSFDPDLPSFHLFGTDLVQMGTKLGRRSYAIDAPVIHHDKPVLNLKGGYADAYKYMRRKWRGSLPLKTMIAPITRFGFGLIATDLHIRWYRRGIRERIAPTSDPSSIARSLGWETSSREEALDEHAD